MHIIGHKLVFKIKHNIDGLVQHNKARLLTKGFHQNLGIDFF